MSKTGRINKRIKRIEDRFRTKVSKGIKGTDMDIEMHERRIKKLKDKTSPLGFTMPHSPLNQNDSIAASKAWKIDTENYRKRKFRGNNPKLGPITPEENERERIGEQSTKYYDTKEQRLKLIPTDDAERQDQEFKSKLKKWQLPPLDRRSPLNQNEKVYNMTPNVSEKEAAGVREKFDRTYMKRGSHAHADSEFEKATYQLMNEGVIKETDNKSIPLIEKRMEENKRNK